MYLLNASRYREASQRWPRKRARMCLGWLFTAKGVSGNSCRTGHGYLYSNTSPLAVSECIPLLATLSLLSCELSAFHEVQGVP